MCSGKCLVGWLQWWKQSDWQHKGKAIWAATLWQDTAALMENLIMKVPYIEMDTPKNWATEEHQNNQKVHQAAKTEVTRVDQNWSRRENYF